MAKKTWKKTFEQKQVEEMKVAYTPFYAKDGKYVMFFDKNDAMQVVIPWIDMETLTILGLKEVQNLELDKIQEDYQNKIYYEKNKNKTLDERLDEHDEWVKRNKEYSQEKLIMMRVAEKCNTYLPSYMR